MESIEVCSVQLLCALCLFFLVAQVSSGWSCVRLKWWSGSHSHASCSPVPPWLCTEGVDGIQNTSPWRFGMTGNTNYYSAASMSPSLCLSHRKKHHSLCLTHTHTLTSAQCDHHYCCGPWGTFWCSGMYCAELCGNEWGWKRWGDTMCHERV